MSCATCDQTMQRVNDGRSPKVFWCPTCGTLKMEPGVPEFETPRIVAVLVALIPHVPAAQPGEPLFELLQRAHAAVTHAPAPAGWDKVEGDRQCPECARQFGPHYTGPCEHGEKLSHVERYGLALADAIFAGWLPPLPPMPHHEQEDRVDAAVACRCAIERAIAWVIINDAIAAGYWLSVNNGGDTDEIAPTKDAGKVFATMFATDEDRLRFHNTCDGSAPSENRGFCNGWVRFIYGNEGWDVVNDYTTNLEPVMKRAEQISNQLCG